MSSAKIRQVCWIRGAVPEMAFMAMQDLTPVRHTVIAAFVFGHLLPVFASAVFTLRLLTGGSSDHSVDRSCVHIYGGLTEIPHCIRKLVIWCSGGTCLGHWPGWQMTLMGDLVTYVTTLTLIVWPAGWCRHKLPRRVDDKCITEG